MNTNAADGGHGTPRPLSPYEPCGPKRTSVAQAGSRHGGFKGFRGHSTDAVCWTLESH